MPLSFSQISSYRRCPKQYAFMHVDRVPRGISAEESFGSSIHIALQRWGVLEMQHAAPQMREQASLFPEESHGSLAPLTLATLQGMVRDAFIAQGYANTHDMEDALRRAIDIAERYYAWWQRKSRTVVAIEEAFRCTLPTTPARSLAGRFDRVEAEGDGIVIYDYKTGPVQSEEDVAKNLQLSLYALAAQERWPTKQATLALLFLSSTNVVEMRTTRAWSSLDEARDIIASTAASIDAKDFRATPSTERCARCPYRMRCPFAL